MPILRSILGAAAAFAFVTSPLNAESPAKPGKLSPPLVAPERLPGGGANATRLVPQVDAKGQAWVLFAEEGTARKLGPEGLESPLQRLTRAEPSYPPSVRAAALAPSGSPWLLLTGVQPVILDGGRESFLEEPPWQPVGVAMVGETPVVLVEPQPIGRWDREPDRSREVPLALTWDGRGWKPLVTEAGLSEQESEALGVWKLTRAAFGRGSPRGRLWVANRYRYRLREFTSSGRPVTEIVLGSAEPRRKAPADVDAQKQQMVQGLKEAGVPASDIPLGKMWVNDGQVLVFDLAEAPDGRLYVLTRSEEDGAPPSLVLDRYDPAELRLARVRLPLAEEKGYQLAAAKDGLYLVAFHLEEAGSFYRIPWETLEQAAWATIESAEIGSGRPDEP
jgi:hypothetical protein